MMIGNKRLDDVELMLGRSVPAERMEVGGKVSLFDFSRANQQRLREWDKVDLIMVEPNTYDWNYHTNRERSELLVKVSNFLKHGIC